MNSFWCSQYLLFLRSFITWRERLQIEQVLGHLCQFCWSRENILRLLMGFMHFSLKDIAIFLYHCDASIISALNYVVVLRYSTLITLEIFQRSNCICDLVQEWSVFTDLRTNMRLLCPIRSIPSLIRDDNFYIKYATMSGETCHGKLVWKV